MPRPLLLDLYCGAGGASEGYHRAGFDVVGVDLFPQPSYPFEFIQMDAIEALACLLHRGLRGFLLCDFVAVHASPPCQAFTTLGALQDDDYFERHVDLVATTRSGLEAIGLPYVIENVEQAPLQNQLRLCGSAFDLPVRRHRGFESNVSLTAPPCNHARWGELWPEGFHRDISKARVAAGSSRRSPVVGVYGNGGGPGKVLSTWKWAMGTSWMKTKHEVAESIPPAYTEHIGKQLLAHIEASR
jgi:DNA (cytosine-5)-methyltransferase 1